MTPRRIRESAPVQVYLVADEQQRLERLADQLDVSKSEVIRRGLLSLERERLSPAAHPALRLIGIAPAEMPGLPDVDAAREHDRVLGESEESQWRARKPGATKRPRKRSAKKPAKRRGR
jgi:hypothetical protein